MPMPRETQPVSKKVRKKKASKKKSAKKVARPSLLEQRLADYERMEKAWGTREDALEARIQEREGELKLSEGTLDVLQQKLDTREKQISASVNNHAMELYSRSRERHGELPLWPVLSDGEQLEWGKLALDVDAMKAKRQALMHKIFLKHGSEAKRFALEAARAERKQNRDAFTREYVDV